MRIRPRPRNSEAVRELFQERPTRWIGLFSGHGPKQVEELVLLFPRQFAHDVSDALQDLDGVVWIHLLVFTAFDEPEDIDQGLGQGSRQGGVCSRH
jgi:hypothetical protein